MSFIGKIQRVSKATLLIVLATMACVASSVWDINSAKAQDALYSAIIVDIEPIRATGLGDIANPIGTAVKRALNRTYAGTINSKDKSLPVLVVEVETIYYGQEEESSISQRMFPNFTRTRDQMSGTAIIRKNKTEIKRESILGNNVTQGGWPPIDDVKSGRLQALANQFAEAVRYELGD